MQVKSHLRGMRLWHFFLESCQNKGLRRILFIQYLCQYHFKFHCDEPSAKKGEGKPTKGFVETRVGRRGRGRLTAGGRAGAQTRSRAKRLMSRVCHRVQSAGEPGAETTRLPGAAPARVPSDAAAYAPPWLPHPHAARCWPCRAAGGTSTPSDHWTSRAGRRRPSCSVPHRHALSSPATRLVPATPPASDASVQPSVAASATGVTEPEPRSATGPEAP